MIRLLIPCLIWLTSVRSEGIAPGMELASAARMEKEPLTDTGLIKQKRHLYHHQPCPPAYSHVPAYHPPPIYVKPYVPPPIVYPKKEISVHPIPNHIQYVQQPTYATVIPKQTVSYVKPQITGVDLHPVQIQPVHPVHPVEAVVKSEYVAPKIVYQKPMYSYAPLYEKPMYSYAPLYEKPMYNPMPKIIYQKPAPLIYKPSIQPISYGHVQYQQPKVIQIQQPVSYVKVAPPMVHHAPPIYVPPPVHAPPAIVKVPLVKPHCD